MASDVIQLGIFYHVGPQPGMNVLHFRDKDPDPIDPDTAAKSVITSFMNEIEELLLDCIPAQAELIGYKAIRINNGGGLTVVKSRGVLGTRTGDISPSCVGPCMIWGYQKATTGWAAGRTFLPGVSEDDIENNLFASTLLSACDDLVTALLQSPALPVSGAGGYDFVIWSPTHDASSGVETGGVSGKPGNLNRRLKPGF